MPDPVFHLFERFGVELEYILVDVDSLAVLPITDRVMEAVCGAPEMSVRRGALDWSNELVLHVMEMKVHEPVRSLDGLSSAFSQSVREANGILAGLGARIMPTAAHPWMDPQRDALLWPHEDREIYEQFDRIFGCRTHGWTNLQSMHINLPFADDEEFGRLHAAIRLLLPLLPGLAASSPFLDGRHEGLLDARLDAYRTNARRVPSVSGYVIPEPVFTRDAYEERILRPIYKDMEVHDKAGTLRFEWLNARGAIARFERNTIEIRVIDMQECPTADLAIAWAAVHVLKALVAEQWAGWEDQKAWEIEPLRALLLGAIRTAEQCIVEDARYAAMFGYPGTVPCTVRDLWAHLVSCAVPHHDTYSPVLDLILEQGCLARRILRAAGSETPTRERLGLVFGDLCDCLADSRMFQS